MATLDDAEFWLPSKFLDDDVFFDRKMTDGLKNKTTCFDFPYASDLNSPVESLFGSSDSTESEEEDVFLTGLTERLAHSSLQHDFPPLHKPSKGWGLPTSPQSTLCGCKRGTPNADLEGSTWDLLYAAAEVARIRMNQQLYSNATNAQNGIFPSTTLKHSPAVNNDGNHSHLPHHAFYQKLQASQFHHLRQQQMMKRAQQYHSHAPLSHNRAPTPNTTLPNDNTRLSPLSPNAWPPLTRTGSGMRAVFLNNPQTNRQCAGTGVFLPRRVGTQTEPRKKQGCSTVLLPAKVVHALNLNMDGGGPTSVPQSHPPRFNTVEKRVMKPQQVLNLPSEWTY